MTKEDGLTLLSGVAYRGREITSPRLRALLALLAGDVRAGVSSARLVNGLWPDEQPENPAKAVQILVSRTRSQLGSDLITTTPAGYRLNLAEEQVDASAVVRHASSSAQHARAGDHVAALTEADAGLALWDSAPTDDGGVPGDPLADLRAERIATYRSLVRARALALARLGRHDEALGPLIELFGERPRDEELLLELLHCEASITGPSAALTRYENYRSELRDELGTDPGRDVQAVYQELLQGTAPVVRQGLSYEPNPLLGRGDDIAAVEALLHSSRVTSIIGPGGLGKTRLAHAVWRRGEERTGFFVPLAGVTEDDGVINEVASVLSVGEAALPQVGAYSHDLLSGIAATLGPGPALLVLDNCEQVIAGVAELVHALVAMTEELRILTTSRAPLGLSSESVYLLPELTMPTMVELFTQRANAARPDVELPDDKVAEICRHLDGLPLAVELAAARVRVMSVEEIARRLDDRFALLRGGPRDTPERHRALQAVVDWSWNLLDPAAQHAMRTLSSLPGGFTADTADHMLGGDSLDTLEQLVEQSLITVTDTSLGTRFRMLETVREFSATARDRAGETDAVVSNLMSWAQHLGLTHYEALFGPDPYMAVDTIRAEQDNLSHAQREAIARADDPTLAATVTLLGTLWLFDSNFPRLAALVDDTSWLLSHYRPDPEYLEITRTALVLSASYTFMIEGMLAKRALVAMRRLPPASAETCSGAMAIILEAGVKDMGGMLALCDSDEPLVAAIANTIATYHWEGEGDIDRALETANRSLEVSLKVAIPVLILNAHSRIGELYFQVERPRESRHHMTAILPITERLGSRANAAGIRWWLVLVNLQLGDLDEAERWMDSVVGVSAYKLGTLGYDLGVRSEVLLARGEVDAGLELWREVVHLLRTNPEQVASGIPAELDPWSVQARVATVVAHAQHGRVELVGDVVAELEDRLGVLLEHPPVNPPPYVIEFQLAGSMLVALGMAALAREQADSGVRMIALGERMGYVHNSQPTMASGRIKKAAEDADRSAYEEAVSSYVDLDRDGLRAAAVAMLQRSAER